MDAVAERRGGSSGLCCRGDLKLQAPLAQPGHFIRGRGSWLTRSRAGAVGQAGWREPVERRLGRLVVAQGLLTGEHAQQWVPCMLYSKALQSHRHVHQSFFWLEWSAMHIGCLTACRAAAHMLSLHKALLAALLSRCGSGTTGQREGNQFFSRPLVPRKFSCDCQATKL